MPIHEVLHFNHQIDHAVLQTNKRNRPQEISAVRECRNNFAHGPMKLRIKQVVIEYRGQQIPCEKTVYACQFCDYELHEKWMEEKLNDDLDRIYNATFNG